MLIDEAQAFALAGGEQPHGILRDDVTRDHSASS